MTHLNSAKFHCAVEHLIWIISLSLLIIHVHLIIACVALWHVQINVRHAQILRADLLLFWTKKIWLASCLLYAAV